MPAVPRQPHRRLIFSTPKAIHDAWRLRYPFFSKPFLDWGSIKSVLQNGLTGRYVCQLQRLTIAYNVSRCNNAAGKARGVEEFARMDLPEFARKNPAVCIYVQPYEQEFVGPESKGQLLIAEYLNGRRFILDAADFTRHELNQWANYLRTRSGQRIVRFENDIKTATPSIQGMWTPFTNKPTEMNIGKWPAEQFSRFQPTALTATEVVQQLGDVASSKYT